MVGIQLVSGLALAVVTPLISIRSHPVTRVQAMRLAGQATPAETAFYVDPGRGVVGVPAVIANRDAPSWSSPDEAVEAP